MEKIILADGTTLNISGIELVKGILKISTTESTVEELAAMFSDKSKTSLITLQTESGKDAGFKNGFTSFAGIVYAADGTKTIELFQPVDVTEARISSVEGSVAEANSKAQALEEQTSVMATTIDSILTEVIPGMMA